MTLYFHITYYQLFICSILSDLFMQHYSSIGVKSSSYPYLRILGISDAVLVDFGCSLHRVLVRWSSYIECNDDEICVEFSFSFVFVFVSADVRMTVDGGTIQWQRFCEGIEKSNLVSLYPHIVSGDFDSLPQKTIDLVKKNGCEVFRTPDQNFTDFTKALQIIHEKDFEV